MLWETVKRLCKYAGIEGQFTRHSLRATTSRGLQKGILDKFEMGRTEHRDVGSWQKYQPPDTLSKMRFQRSSNVIFCLQLCWKLSLNCSSRGWNYVFRNNRVELQLIATRTFLRIHFPNLFRFWVCLSKIPQVAGFICINRSFEGFYTDKFLSIVMNSIHQPRSSLLRCQALPGFSVCWTFKRVLR